MPFEIVIADVVYAGFPGRRRTHLDLGQLGAQRSHPRRKRRVVDRIRLLHQ